MRFHLSDNMVDLEYRKVVIAFGVPSEVLIAGVKDSAQGAAADAAKQHGLGDRINNR